MLEDDLLRRGIALVASRAPPYGVLEQSTISELF